MAGITFNGLASGLDTGALIEKLVSSERAAASKLVTRQSDLNTHKSIVGSLSTALAAFGTAVRGLDTLAELQPRTATVSDSRVGVAVSSTAAAGTHDLRVAQLATAQITKSRTFASPAAGALGTGGVAITVGGVTRSVDWTSADSLDAIAGKLNDANAGVTAGVVFDGTVHRLVVTAKATGTAAAATFVDSGDGLGLSSGANVVVPAKDAIVHVDGIAITRPTNVITDALAGTTLTLNAEHAVTDPASKVTVGFDTKALTEKLKTMVGAYNAVNSALHVQLDFTGTTKGTNTLFGDSTLRQLQGSLGAVLGNSYGTTGATSLSALGITRDKSGTMTLDETKLAAAVAGSANGVAELFVTNGFAAAATALADQYTQSGGALATKTQGLTDRHKALQTQIDRINKNADALQTRLEKQFGALEQAISRMQSQSGFLNNLFK